MEAPFNPTADPRPPNWGIFGATSEEILRAIDRWASDKAGLEDDRARAGSAPPQGPGYRESVEQAKGAQRPTSRARMGMVVGRAK